MTRAGTPRAKRPSILKCFQPPVQSDGEIDTRSSAEPRELERGRELFPAWPLVHPDGQWRRGLTSICMDFSLRII